LLFSNYKLKKSSSLPFINNRFNHPLFLVLCLCLFTSLEDVLILWLELVVNNWTKNQNYLFAIEVPNPWADCIDLAIPADDNNHWAARAIKNNHISLSDDEFIDFLQKVKNSTFAVFRIKWQGSVIYYWMGITNTR
jgi:hypothetical protein